MTPRRAIRRAAAGALALLIAASCLAGERFVVLVGGKGRAFEDAAAGAVAVLERGRRGALVDVVHLSGGGATIPDGATAYIALGDAAVRAASAPKREPVVAGMVVDEKSASNGQTAVVTLEFATETQLRWIREVLPDAKSLGVLFDPRAHGERIANAEREATRLGLTLIKVEVSSRSDLARSLRVLSNRVDALWALPDTTVYSASTLEPILAHAYANKLPVIGLSAAWVKAGALVAPERDYRDIGAQCAEIALRIASGADAAALTPQPPRRFLYSVNRRSADYLRVALSREAIANAELVVE